MDTAKTAGALAVGAVLLLALLRKGFGGVNVTLGS